LVAACWASAKANAATNAEALLKMLLNNTEQLIHAEHPCAGQQTPLGAGSGGAQEGDVASPGGDMIDVVAGRERVGGLLDVSTVERDWSVSSATTARRRTS